VFGEFVRGALTRVGVGEVERDFDSREERRLEFAELNSRPGCCNRGVDMPSLRLND
jgi:hypothetical protein